MLTRHAMGRKFDQLQFARRNAAGDPDVGERAGLAAAHMLKGAPFQHGGLQCELRRKPLFYFWLARNGPCLEINNARRAIGENVDTVGARAEPEVRCADFQLKQPLHLGENMNRIVAQQGFVLNDPPGQAPEPCPPETHDLRIVPERTENLLATGDEARHRIVGKVWIKREKVAMALWKSVPRRAASGAAAMSGSGLSFSTASA